MSCELLPEEKIINKYPNPYTKECSLYSSKVDFSDLTYERCATENKILNSGWFKVCKVIIIGDSSVGKTCIVNRFSQKFFDSNYKSTIGVDFEVQKFSILNVSYTLQIWDTAGQERFKSIARSYYRSAHAIVVVFDLNNLESLNNCKKWLNDSLQANCFSKPLVFLVGTKADLVGQFMLKTTESLAINLAKKLDAEYWTLSAKSGKNVDALFRRIAALSFDNLINDCKLEKADILIGEKLIPSTFSAGSEEKSKKHCKRQCCKTV